MSTPTDWTALPLAGHGRSLVEASAGTGKTWTIAALYLRLLLEQDLSPRRIVVSTFTNAAASELAERLRGKLRWALAEAERHGTYDPTAPDVPGDRAWIHARWSGDEATWTRDIQRLQVALADFDAAPISTLHALCARILADHPFAAGALFRGRRMIDGKTLETALVEDLWRVITQGDASDPLVQLAQAAQITVSALRTYVPALLQPTVQVAALDPATIVSAVTAVIGDVAGWIETVRTVWAADGLINRARRLPKAWKVLADALEGVDGDLATALSDYRGDLAKAADKIGINKKGVDHPLVQQLLDVSPALADCVPTTVLDRTMCAPLRSFLAAAQQWCRAAMQARLEAANQSTFDQLLFTVHDALQARDGQRALADALFADWPVALVDEFQDTDPVQFGILDAIYRDADGAPRGRLVMIGDPKQAIYRFRGGDVQAYARAKAAVPDSDRLTLDTNHRSSRAYVEAVNQFYHRTGVRLEPADSATGIVYETVQASGRRDATPLCERSDGTPVGQPLVLHVLEAEDGGDVNQDRALRACAGQIVQALSATGLAIGDRPVQPGDIAVLLPGHAQIAALARMLKARGVPCVALSQNSVFDTGTARELRLVLHAVLHADDPRALRAALATRLWGGSLKQLQALRHDAAAWHAQAARMRALHEALLTRGPLAVVGALLEQHAARLLDTVDGERLLTDLRHLGELLQAAWDDCGAGGERLMAWFADQMDGNDEDADGIDTRALRLESDAARVKLMTLHVSKGLEFNIVFLPLMWKHSRHRGAAKSAHLLGEADGPGKALMLGPAKTLVQQQEFEERYRILYVALTRAVYACHVFAVARGVGKPPADAPLNTLDLDALWPAAGAPAACIARRRGWNAHPDAMRASDDPTPTARAARALPVPPAGPLPMRHSFTTLSGGGRRTVAEDAAAAEDETLPAALSQDADAATAAADVAVTTPVAVSVDPALDALAGVAGADFGNAVHALFEHRQPGAPITPAQVRAALQAHGVRPREGAVEALVEPLAARLQAVLDTPLGDDAGPRLGDLQGGEQCAELEFNYLLDGVSLRALHDVCEAHGETGLVPAHGHTLAGLMNGKIDLVFAHGGRFHVLDYKGNRLGQGARQALEDYGPEALEAAMRRTGYRFQALLYTVAVERYLRERLGDGYRRALHLGDCWYLFVRAVGLHLPDGRACGVWRHRFRDDLLDAVQAVLGAQTAQEAA